MRTLIFIFFLVSMSWAGSLWKEEYGSAYGTSRAHKVGDIVTIIIDEKNTAVHNADTNLRKDTQVTGKANLSWSQAISFISKSDTAKTDGDVGISGKNTFAGRGQTGRSSKLNAVLAAVIYQVEGENCRIRGSKKIVINSEEELLSLDGLIRKTDVREDNTIHSSLISDATLRIKGHGAIANEQEKGFLPRLIEWIF
jgi:flagellar L-ring protein FlgH